jgi:hypothetical protein
MKLDISTHTLYLTRRAGRLSTSTTSDQSRRGTDEHGVEAVVEET